MRISSSFAAMAASSVSVTLFSRLAAAANIGLRQTSFTPAIGAQNANGVVNRLPFDELRVGQPDVFNMYILGMKAFMNTDETTLTSYYQIAGIHGRPYIPWEEPVSSNQDPTTGYCTHSSVLFGYVAPRMKPAATG